MARKVRLGLFQPHDVRHAELAMAAQNGATTRDVMARAAHCTARASLIYQHTAEERNIAIAAGFDIFAERATIATGELSARSMS